MAADRGSDVGAPWWGRPFDEVAPVGPVACAGTAWSHGGEARVTVVVRATFALVHESRGTLTHPRALSVFDRRRAGPTSSLVAASHLAPRRDRVDVTLVGSAHAPPTGPVRTAAVRLALYGGGGVPLLDKTLHVYGDRDDPREPPRPFDRMELSWERALGGPAVAQNPVGTGASAARPAPPNVVDPRSPERPACFGPIAPEWAPRAGRRPRIVTSSRGALPVLPADFDASWFSAAPEDQRIATLSGDEWIVIDGAHPALPRMQTRLPGAQGVARIHALRNGAWGPGQELGLWADTLEIDGDEQTASVCWRGSFAVPGGERGLGLVRVFCGVELPGVGVAWPSPGPAPSIETRGGEAPSIETVTETVTRQVVPGRADAHAIVGPALEPDPDGTTTTLHMKRDEDSILELSSDALEPAPQSSTLTWAALSAQAPDAQAPFPLPPARQGDAPKTGDVPGAPWSGEAVQPAPPPLGEDYVTSLLVDVPRVRLPSGGKPGGRDG